MKKNRELFIEKDCKNQKWKFILEEAFAVPEPEKKTEFIKKAQLPKLSTFAFMLQQVFYIRKITWLISFFISVCAFLCADAIGKDCVWIISSMVPLLAVCSITESARSKTYGMAELEQASRFSLKSVMLARMGIMSFLHLIIFVVLVPFAGNRMRRMEAGNGMLQIVQESIWRIGGTGLGVSIYLFVPYLLTSVLCLMTVRKMQGKEVNYVCMGISVGMGLINFILKASLPAMYEEKAVIWWYIAGIYFTARLWEECRKMIKQTEEFV